MKNLFTYHGLTVIQTVEREQSYQFCFVNDGSGLALTIDVSKEDYNIFGFITTEDFCYANLHIYEEVISVLIKKLKEGDL